MTQFKEILDKAIRLQKEGKFEPSLEILEELYERYPQSEDAKKHLIDVLFDFGGYLSDEWTLGYDKATECFKRIIELEPTHYRAWYNLGIAYFNLNKTEEALNAYSEALKLKPDYTYCYYNIGLVYEVQKNDLEKALEYYEKALSYNENFMYALHAKKTVQQKIDILKKNQKR